MPATMGDMNQLETIFPTWSQCTASTDMQTAASPTIEPTMLWVVETDQPNTVAISSQIPAASKADNIPRTAALADHSPSSNQ